MRLSSGTQETTMNPIPDEYPYEIDRVVLFIKSLHNSEYLQRVDQRDHEPDLWL